MHYRDMRSHTVASRKAFRIVGVLVGEWDGNDYNREKTMILS